LHNLGLIKGYTSTRLPVTPVFSQDLSTRDEALSAELQLKGWACAKEEVLIRGDWDRVRELAQNRVLRPGSGRTTLTAASDGGVPASQTT
jgi:putative endonuclease